MYLEISLTFDLIMSFHGHTEEVGGRLHQTVDLSVVHFQTKRRVVTQT